MYTFKIIYPHDEIYGPICHNYSTAFREANKELSKLIGSGWVIEDGSNSDDIKIPYDVKLKREGSTARIYICSILLQDI
jgi:hypothetical protein